MISKRRRLKTIAAAIYPAAARAMGMMPITPCITAIIVVGSSSNSTYAWLAAIDSISLRYDRVGIARMPNAMMAEAARWPILNAPARNRVCLSRRSLFRQSAQHSIAAERVRPMPTSPHAKRRALRNSKTATVSRTSTPVRRQVGRRSNRSAPMSQIASTNAFPMSG